MRKPVLALLLGALAAGSIQPTGAGAQATRFDELKAATDDVAALIDAEARKSALCKGYVGQVVTPASFGALTAGLPDSSPKGEFETTAQYRVRIAGAARQSSGRPFIVVVPVNRDHLRYEADDQTMFVEAGAFRVGQFSDEPGADASASLSRPEGLSDGTRIFHSVGPARLVRSYSARSRSGVPFRVTESERTTNALYVTTPKLFGFARASSSPVMGWRVPLARAPQVKATLKLALAVEPRTPFLWRGSLGPTVPSLARPDVYKERTVVAVVAARCGLVLDAQNRVLAAMDAGT